MLSLCGSLALVELAVAHPKTGGLYVFIREGFGDAWAFTFGWANLWVIKPTLIAAITFVFAEYFCDAVGLPRGALLPAGCAAILLLTGVNALGVRQGAGTASLFTTLKVLGIAALCVAAFALPHSGAPGPAFGGYPAPAAAAHAARPLLLALVLAMIPVLFAYDGWTDATYVGGEIVEPQRNLPIAILWGTVLVIAIYVVTNLAYFRVLTPGEVAAYPVVGAETMRRILGPWGSRALAVLVAVSAFGTVNGAILTGPRVTLAMAADGLLWKPLAHVDPRRLRARPRAVAAGGAGLPLAVDRQLVRGRLGLVRDHDVALLRRDDRGALRPAPPRARVRRAPLRATARRSTRSRPSSSSSSPWPSSRATCRPAAGAPRPA